MGKKSPKAPAAPDPVQVSNAQTTANLDAARTQARINNVNEVNPYYSISYSNDGDTWARNIALSPEQQQLFNAQMAGQQASTDALNSQIGRVNATISQPVGFDGAPAQVGSIDQSGLPGLVGNIDTSRLPPALAGSGADFSADRQRVENALFERMNPQIERDREALRTQLANQGIGMGSQAYSGAFQDFGSQVNDARLAAIAQAGDEQQRLFNMASAARGQEFDIALANANLSNAARAQEFNQRQNAGAFQNSARQQAIQEMLTRRQLPLNEMAALMSGNQVQLPSFGGNPTTQVQPTNVAGPVYSSYQGNMNAWQQQQANRQSTLGNIFGLGGAALGGWASGGFSLGKTPTPVG